jgi:hypothetical protein
LNLLLLYDVSKTEGEMTLNKERQNKQTLPDTGLTGIGACIKRESSIFDIKRESLFFYALVYTFFKMNKI